MKDALTVLVAIFGALASVMLLVSIEALCWGIVVYLLAAMLSSGLSFTTSWVIGFVVVMLSVAFRRSPA